MSDGPSTMDGSETSGAAPSPRTAVRCLAERGVYDHHTVSRILDEALVCYVGLVHDGHPVVIPTIHARIGNILYLHGSPASRMLRSMKRGAEICVTTAIVDGLVVARSPFHNSMNYRSVVVYGTPRFVEDPEEQSAAFEAITEHVVPGRWGDSRPPNEKESKGTLIVAITLDEASAKVREGGPSDEPEDYDLPFWAGVLPISTRYGSPIVDEKLTVDVAVPDYLIDYTRPES